MIGHVLTHHRAVLEPVTGTASDDPDVVELGMSIDDEVSTLSVRGETRVSSRGLSRGWQAVPLELWLLRSRRVPRHAAELRT